MEINRGGSWQVDQPAPAAQSVTGPGDGGGARGVTPIWYSQHSMVKDSVCVCVWVGELSQFVPLHQ